MSEEQPRESVALTCDEVPALVRVYVARELGKDSLQLMRRHLASCPECMEMYRESVGTAAALSRMTSKEREKRMLDRKRHARHAEAFGLDRDPKPARRHFRLRIVLIPAVVIYLLTQLTVFGPPPGKVEITDASRGVKIDQRVVDTDEGNALVLPGRWILTDRFANATIDARTCELHLGASTDLLVESARPLRFRLRSGSVSLVGTATFVTVLGLLEVEEARGSLIMGDHGWLVMPESGRWTVFDKDGSQELELGVEHSFGMQL